MIILLYDPHTFAMQLSGVFKIGPLSILSLSTGIIQAYFTPWGLLKHYWIITKLVLTEVTIILLFLHMDPVNKLGILALEGNLTGDQAIGLRFQLTLDAALAILVILFMTGVSVFKPWGKLQVKSRSDLIKNYRIYILSECIFILILIIIMKHLKSGH